MTKPRRPAIALACAGLALLMFSVAPTLRGDDHREEREGSDEARIKRGLAHAPVPLNLKGKNLDLVGLGSYFVNVAGDCNGCHTSDQANPYLPGHNPYLGESELIDPDKYLVGGSEFIPAHGDFPAIVSRNLRPEANGLPAGRTLAEFREILRTGIDLDHAHPQYGPLLQVMPWPAFGKMTNRDIRAIYEYLSALPPNPKPVP
ncbi:MAG: cytochrome C [Bryobacteraceae bacterium]